MKVCFLGGRGVFYAVLIAMHCLSAVRVMMGVAVLQRYSSGKDFCIACF